MNQHDIKRLQKIYGYPCVSIFVPTHRTMPGRLQDPIRIKDLVKKAVSMLSKEFSQREVDPFIAKLDALAAQIDYTKNLDGIVFFISKDIAEIHVVPFSVPEKIVVDDTFYTRPIVKAFNRGFHYWVLLLNTKPARLFEGFGPTLAEINDSAEARAEQKGFPFEWQWEVSSDRIVQATQSGFKDASYKTAKDLEFFQQVDQALDIHLTHDNFPLIVLGPEENWGEFKKVTKYIARIIAYGAGNYAHASLDDLTREAMSVIQAYIAQEQASTLTMFFESVGTPNHAAGILEVWQRAYEGRVRILLVEEGFSVSGFKNVEKPQEIVVHEDKAASGISIDLVDDLIELVLSKGGNVVFVSKNSLEKHGHVGAILRY